MNAKAPLFFCAIGGSGMLPLALIMKSRGFDVRGSDRSRDQGRTPERFAFIERQGISLFPQDGSGVNAGIGRLVVSSAVETTVPDYQAALSLGIPVVSRAALLADLFNEASSNIAVAGTSGKSTTTGMIGWILYSAGLNPTVLSGAVMKNFITKDIPFASAVIGNPDLFVGEVDESDGSISLYTPGIAVVTNIAFDHKSMDELRSLFKDFIGKAGKVVLNLDNKETAALAGIIPAHARITFSLNDASATLCASNLTFNDGGAHCDVTIRDTKERVPVTLNVTGQHNVANALAAMGATMAAGVAPHAAARYLSGFTGIGRRLDVVGTTPDGITVIDDFAHNPDKIAASLRTLHQTPGRLLVLFQPHGYGPLKLMIKELAACFATELAKEDMLFVSDPLYLGGTTDKTITGADLVHCIAATGGNAVHVASRDAAAEKMLREARPADKLVIMGARDDTLSKLAADLYGNLKNKT
jgi:UDP-N-acetylmuramate--alanine ligase